MQRTRRGRIRTLAPQDGGGMMKNALRPARLMLGMARLPRFSRVVAWAANLSIIVFSGLLAFLLRFDFRLTPHATNCLAYALPLWLVAKSAAFRWRDLDRGWWRHTSVSEVLSCGAGNLAGSIAGGILILAFAPAGFPRSIYFLDLLVCMHASFAVRL